MQQTLEGKSAVHAVQESGREGTPVDIPLRSEDVGHWSLRRYALDKVCSCLASADPEVRATLFSRLCGSGPPAPSHTSLSSGGAATASPAAAAAALTAVPPGGDEGSSVGIPSSIGDSIITRTREMGCQTTSGILDLLRWCTPRVLDLEGVSPAVTDSLLLRYPGESCAMLEEVCLGWCPHLLEVEALLLKIRNAGVDGQEDEACALRVLDVSGSEGLSDGILKALAGRCPALSTLKIDACPAVTGAFLPRLAEGCPSLAQLSADACTGITDGAVSNFIMESQAVASGSLHSLRLGDCPIGSLTAQALLMRGSCLLELNLDGCSGFGDAAVRMVCRACPGLLELSLLGCSTLTSRGAWHCTQHPSVEALTITLPLRPGIEPILPAPEKPRRRAAGGGGGHRGDQQHRDADGEARAAAGVRNGEGVAGAAAEQWVCSRCTLLNAERRSTCQACRTPRGTREPPTPPPRAATSSPASGPLPVSPGSFNGGRRRRGRSPSRSPSRSRSPAARKPPTTAECAPFPLPPVPSSGHLRRLCLELQPAAASVLGAGQDDGGGVRSNPSNRSSPATAARCAFPLRRLAPLLPPGLTSLEVWSANARPVPRSVQRDATSGGRKRPIGRRLGRGGGSSSGGAWRMLSAAADGGGETPAGIEGAGSSGAKGTGRGRQRSGGGDDDGDDGDAFEGVASGVALLAGPGDLLSVSQASPSLQELVVSGDPEQATAAGLSPSGVRIRGRGADAHTTMAAAGVHATAAAIAYFLSYLGSAPPPPSTTGDNRGSSGSATSGGGGGGGFSRFDSPGTTRPSPPSPLRLLAIFDCPSVPPMAVLEALAVQGVAGLDHVAVGVSKPPPPPPPREGVDAAGVGLGDDGGRVTLSSETLKSLHVSGEAALGAVALRCPRLEGVEFVNCPRLGEVEVTATPSLVDARVQNCGVGSGALMGLTKACGRLETLDVSGSSAVGDQVLLSALAGCPRLKTLRAIGCRDVGGSPLLLPFLLSPTAAAPPPPPPSPPTTHLPPLLCRLEELAVSHAPGLTGAHLAALAGGLPLLRRLSVSHCRGLIEVAASSGRSGDGVTGVVHGGGGGGGGGGRGRGGGPEGCGFGDTDRVDPGRGVQVRNASGGEEDGEYEDREERLKTKTAVENDGAVSVARGGETGGGGDGRAARSNGGDEGGRESSLAKGKGTKRRQRRLEDVQQRAGANSEGGGERRERPAVASAADCDAHDHDRGGNTAATASGDESGRRSAGDENVAATINGGGKDEPRVSRKDARAAAKKRQGAAVRHQGPGGGVGDARDAPAAEPIAAGEGRDGRGKRGGGKRGQGDEDDDCGGDGGDVCQGLEFRVDGKTRDKLERLAAALPREPGRKKVSRPSCIRFLQDKCPNSARDCAWAHLPMHPPKTLKFKPLITHAQEPASASSSSTKRNVSSSRSQPPPPPPQASAASLSGSPRSRRPDGGRSGGNGAGSSGTVFEPAARRGERTGVGGGGGAGGEGRGFERAGGTAGFKSRRDGSRGGDGSAPEVCFKNLQFLEIHSCPGLKRLEGVRCPALAVARVTACRELISLGLEEAFVLSHLDLAGCVRLEPWELPPLAPPGGNAASSGGASSASLAELRVVVLNYCRGLQAKFLAKLVDHAKHLRRLEIYGTAAVVGPHPHGGGSSKAKKEQTAGKRDLSRAEFNRLATKATAILKGLDKGRPKLVVVRTKKEFLRKQEGAPEGGN